MAPEMALGEDVDGRADLYALGCVAYYLLTGQQVFTGDTLLKVITQHLQAVPVPPSDRTELPIAATLEHVVLACLAKKPEDRQNRTATGAVARSDRWDDVGRGRGGPVVERASSTPGIGIRGDYSSSWAAHSASTWRSSIVGAQSLWRLLHFIYECATVITTFPFLCPCSTYLKASAICSRG